MARLSVAEESKMEAVNAEIIPLIEKLCGSGKPRMEVAKGLGLKYQSFSSKFNGYIRWQEKDLESAKKLIADWGI